MEDMAVDLWNSPQHGVVDVYLGARVYEGDRCGVAGFVESCMALIGNYLRVSCRKLFFKSPQIQTSSRGPKKTINWTIAQSGLTLMVTLKILIVATAHMVSDIDISWMRNEKIWFWN